ncbi:MAG: FecR domain-containing protein [Acidobacteriia bacterium]|nr:FecR domain-containing protein [Terriglobia bacterium]
MNIARIVRKVALAVTVICCGSLILRADPPGRVGRINFIQGPVSFRPATVDDWGPATPNYPLTTGDHLWTDQGSRTEIHIGSTAIRMADQTEIGFLNLSDEAIQIRLSQGSLNLRVRHFDADDAYEVDTPNVAVSLLRPGSYRIDVDPDGDTNVSVVQGEAEVTANASAFSVYPRQVAIITGIDQPTYDIRPVGPPDGWDQWCLNRDRREDHISSLRYVSADMVGYEDLDTYGTWHATPEYGSVWFPTSVAQGWAPYRFGHWVWVEPWGWTWVDDAPWGFAPFHYGRWVFIDDTWGWIPGTYVARPVYAPALVAFIGGRNWNISIGVGGGVGVGWFPLGPHELYVPSYAVSTTYIRNVNVTNVNVTNINVQNINVTRINYVNRTVPNAVTVVPQQAFGRTESAAKARIAVNSREVISAPVTGTTAPVTPRVENVLGRPESGSKEVPRPPSTVVQRPVVAHMPPPQHPAPFEARQPANQGNQQPPVNRRGEEAPKAAAPPQSPNRVSPTFPSQGQPVNPRPEETPKTVQPQPRPSPTPPQNQENQGRPANPRFEENRRPITPQQPQQPQQPQPNQRPANVRPAVPPRPAEGGAPPAMQPARPGITPPHPAAPKERPEARKGSDEQNKNDKNKENPRKEDRK